MKISAYLIIYNDYDILEAALSSVVAYVDEIIVVDGAYTWLAPFFERVGTDPEHSSSECLDIINRFRTLVTIKYFSGLWSDESHKRTFAYEQCEGDLVWLIDADEIFTVDETALKRFAASDRIVAGFIAPTLLTDTLAFKRRDRETFGIKNAMLKRVELTAQEHLGALWLVIPEEERQHITPIRGNQTFGEPLGFNYHATLLRTYRTSIHRARFYVINAIRSTGRAFWLPGRSGLNLGQIAELVDFVPVDQLNRCLLGHRIAIGLPSLEDREVVHVEIPEPAKAAVSKTFSNFMSSWKDISPAIPANFRALANAVPHSIDITAALATCPKGDVAITWVTDVPATRWTVRLLILGPSTEFASQTLAVSSRGEEVVALAHLDEIGFSRAVIEIAAEATVHGFTFITLSQLNCVSHSAAVFYAET